MTESESTTRKKRIDEKLKSSILNWVIIHNSKVNDYTKLSNHAVEEYPTETGPADYALFVDGKLLGIIEAKKISVGAGQCTGTGKALRKRGPKHCWGMARLQSAISLFDKWRVNIPS